MEYKFSDLFNWCSGKSIMATGGDIPIYGSNGIIGYTDIAKYNNKRFFVKCWGVDSEKRIHEQIKIQFFSLQAIPPASFCIRRKAKFASACFQNFDTRTLSVLVP